MPASQQFIFRYSGCLKSPSETHQFNEFPYPQWSSNWWPSISHCYFLLLEPGACKDLKFVHMLLSLYIKTTHGDPAITHYTEKNNKWLWVIFSSGFWRMYMCGDIWKVPGTSVADNLELFRREMNSVSASKMALLSFRDITWD